jgi:hypothetical protein
MARVFLTFFVSAGAALALACSSDRAADTTPRGSERTLAGLAALLPADNEVPGWRVSEAPRTFSADNLWELINGAADGYVAYGFQEVVTADYEQAGTGQEAVIEIYRMKDALNAFGKYSEERSPEYRFLDVGNEGYSGGTSFNFWMGQYYVKITTFDENDAVEAELEKLARAVAAKVTETGAEPAELSYFPPESQVPRSTVYIPRDVLAQSFLTNGFEARYEAGGREYKLVLIGMENEAAASDALRRYRQTLEKGATGMRDISAPGDEGFAGKDGFYGNMIAVRSGRHIAVALGVPSEQAGLKQLAELVGNTR